MARIRTIKPEFFTSLTIANLSIHARLTFIGLWTQADDAGRCVADARLAKAAIWPLDDRTTADVERDIKELTESSLITHYTVGERSYFAINGWREHQKINRPTESKLPAPPTRDSTQRVDEPIRKDAPPPAKTPTHDNLSEDSVRTHDELSEDSRQERKGKEGKGKELSSSAPASDDGNPESEPVDEEPQRDDIEHICTHLANRVESNGSKRPKITKTWRKEARLLLDLDGRTVDQAIRCIDWCQNDTFWRKNIMSMSKLREQYDRLRLAAQDQADHRTKPGRTGPYRQPDVGDDVDWAAGL